MKRPGWPTGWRRLTRCMCLEKQPALLCKVHRIKRPLGQIARLTQPLQIRRPVRAA